MKRSAIATLTALAVVTAVLVQVPAQANQPKMKAALDNLYQARQNLEQADHDKGGHRVKAIRLIDEAIQEVQEGIQSGRL